MSALPGRPAHELLYDSEATLRLVDTALASIDVSDASDEGGAPRPIGLIALTQLLERGYSEITNVLTSLRQSRNMLERRAVENLERTHAKLKEVSNATEIAATNVLDGLERAVAMIDELDGPALSAEDAAATRGRLRDELFALMGHMQFQDITTQQLSYASSVLSDVQERLSSLVALFDPHFGGAAGSPAVDAAHPEGAHATFDPAASIENAEERQSVADEIFTQRNRAG